MARNILMTWVSDRKGWLKWHKGKMYSVSCRQLGTEPTKEASWLAANQWWEAKQASLDAVAEADAVPPTADAKEVIRRALSGRSVKELDAVIHQGLAAAKAKKLLEMVSLQGAGPVEQLPNGSFVGPMPVPEDALEQIRKGQPIPDDVLDEVLTTPDARLMDFLGSLPRTSPMSADDRALLAERLETDLKGQETVEPERTIRAQVEAWLLTLRAAVANGSISPGRYDSYARHIGKFRDWAGSDRPLDILNAAKLEAWWAYLSERLQEGRADRISPDTARLSLMTAKQWLSWLAERSLIPLPGNIRSRRLTIPTVSADPSPFKVSQVKALLAGCDGFSERTKLYLLLMLNCGMYQNDIAELGEDEVDWEKGIVTRTRSKTRERGQKVAYPLWPETRELLEKFRWRGDPVLNDRGQPRVLTTEDGNPLVRYWMEEGKQRRYDVIQSAWTRLVVRVKVSGSLKSFRKTSATLLDHSEKYQDCSDLFLAHSPKGVKGRNYVPANQKKFDKAVAWLRTQYDLE